MFGLPGKSKTAESETIVYTEPARREAVLRLEIGGRLPNAVLDLAEKVPDAVKNVAGGLPDQAKAARQMAGKLSGRVSDRAKAVSETLPDRARAVAERLPDRDSALALVDRLPDPMRDLAQDKLGLKPRRRSRWKRIAIVAAIVAGVAAALVVAKRVFAPGYDEESLYDGFPEDRSGGAGEPHAYPSTGSGTGWPEPQHTREHTESLADTNGVTSRTESVASPGTSETHRDREAAPFTLAESPRPDMPSASLTGAEAQQPAHTTPSVAPEAMPPRESRAEDGSFYAPESRGGDAAPAEPSLPAQRPEAPLTEQQAEMNARLQLKQDQLYAAFPGMSREDIVASDGYLDRLTDILVHRCHMSADEVRKTLDEILETGPKEATNPVLPDVD